MRTLPVILLFCSILGAHRVSAQPYYKNEPVWFSSEANFTRGMAVGDVNGDGFPDLVCGNSGDQNTLYLNVGGTLETIPTWRTFQAGDTRGVAIGDIFGDPTPEIVFANRSERNEIYSTQGGNALGWALVWESDSLFDSRSIGLGDIDNDGDLDLVFGNNDQPNTVYLNTAGVISTSPDWMSATSGRTRRVALGDIDNDGDLDLVCANESESNTIYFNGGAMFADTTAWQSVETDKSLGLSLGDIDGDGDLDAAFGNQGNADVLYLNTGTTLAPTAAWTATLATATHDIAFGDVDGDGDLDLVAANSGEPNMVYLNTGGVLDTLAAWSSTQQFNNAKTLAVADIDADGDLDLLTGSGGQPTGINTMYRNDQPPLAMSAVWHTSDAAVTRQVKVVDVDGDLDPDALFLNDGAAATLHLNDAGVLDTMAAWTGNSITSVAGAAIGDVNDDGRPDLVVAGTGGLGLYLNTGSALADTSAWSPSEQHGAISVALGDIDGDGLLDLVCGNYRSPPTLYLNSGGGLADTVAWIGNVEHTTRSIALGDIDGDFDLDLVCGNADFLGAAEAANAAYRNLGGVFTADPTWLSGPTNETQDIALADLDGDGDLDVICANGDEASVFGRQVNTIYKNERGFISNAPDWSSARVEYSYGVAAEDVDGDGDIDLLFANSDTHYLYKNDLLQCGDVFFSISAEPDWSQPSGPGRDVVLADIDLDGDLDALFANGARSRPLANTLVPGITIPPLPRGSTPSHHIHTGDPYVRNVRVIPTGENQLQIRFDVVDVESDMATIYLTGHRDGCVFKSVLIPGLPFTLSLAGSPEGSGHVIDWDYSLIPFETPNLVLSFKAVPATQRVAYTQRVTTYRRSVGQLTPQRPELSLKPDIIDFPTVTVGDTVFVDVSLSNNGNRNLEISDVQLPQGNMEVVPAPPYTVEPRRNKLIRILHMPTGEISIPATTRILSNDLFEPVRDLITRTTVLGLEFETRLLNDQPELPVNEAITIVVDPAVDVHIEGGSLYYRETGAATFEQIPLVPFADQFVALIPATAVSESGIDYYVEVSNSGVSGTDPFDAPANFYHKDVATPPDVAFPVAVFPNSPNGFEAGREIAMTVDLPPGFTFVDARVNARIGGRSTYTGVSFDMSGSLPSVAIPDSLVTSRGLEYWIEVITLTRTLTAPSVDPAGSPLALPITVLDLEEPQEAAGRSYRMVTVPLDFGGDVTKTLESILSDQPAFGPYDHFKWRSFRYVPGDARYAEAGEAADADQFVLVPGRAFWLIAAGTNRVNTAPVDGVSTRTTEPFSIVLDPGWNQIGCPFNFPVAWDSVIVGTLPRSQAQGVTVEGPVGWSSGGFETDVAILEPFRGYWVKNLTQNALTLRVPAEETVGSVSARTRSGVGWSLGIEASSQGVSDRAVRIGVDADSQNERDASDRARPPTPPGDYLSVHLPHRNWNAGADVYVCDYRAAGEPGHVWRFDVAKGFSRERSGDDVILSVTGIGDLPTNLDASLVDRESGRIVDLHERTEYRLFLGTRPAAMSADDTRFALVVGEVSWVEAEATALVSIPTATALHQNYPNPFNPSTLIPYDMSSRGPVDLRIYDVTGALVKVLESRERDAGRYQIRWSGDNDGGTPVASGVYFYRLTTPGFTQTRKMLLLK